MTKLAPCPFCGSDNVMIENFSTYSENATVLVKPEFTVTCENEQCGAFGPTRSSSEEAAEVWNARAMVIA